MDLSNATLQAALAALSDIGAVPLIGTAGCLLAPEVPEAPELPADLARACAHCGAPIDDQLVGRPRRFCSGACRFAAYRRRRSGLPEDSPRSTLRLLRRARAPRPAVSSSREA